MAKKKVALDIDLGKVPFGIMNVLGGFLDELVSRGDIKGFKLKEKK